MTPTIGLIGAGSWGHKILITLRSLGVTVLVCDSDPTRRMQAQKLGVAFTTAHVHDLRTCDGLIVATPASTHRDVLTSIASFGKPIFVEKPLASRYSDALAIGQLALPPTFLMHIWAYHPGIRLLAELTRTGALGTLTGLYSTRTNWTSPRTDTDTAHTLLPHDLTIVRAILGNVPSPRACLTERHNGVVRGLTALLGLDPAVVLTVSTRHADKRREVRLHGTAGVAILASEQVDYVDIWWGDDQTSSTQCRHERQFFDPTPPLQLEVAAFLHYLQGGPPPLAPLQEGIDTMRLIDELLTLSQ